jgi:dihydroorotase
MSRTLIYNANLVNEGKIIHGSLVINNEDIEQLLPDSKLPTYPCDKMINANNGYLLPGIIDEHVHFRDPGLTDKADIHTESMAAAAGGVTSIMDMPNTIPHTTTLEALEQKRELMAEKCIVNYSCYFGATNTNTNLFHKLDAHKVCGIKLFMGSSTGNLMVDNMEALTRIFKETEMLITTHCESQLVINANLENLNI